MVAVEVTDEMGATDFATLFIDVTRFNRAPVLSSSASPSSGLSPLDVYFLANAMDPDNDPLSSVWDFGDLANPDNVSHLANPSHTYSTPGLYAATREVGDGYTTTRKTLAINTSANSVPEPAAWALLLTGHALMLSQRVPSRSQLA